MAVRLTGDGVRRLLSCGAHVSLLDFVLIAVSSLDSVSIGRFFGAQQLGFYRQAFQLVTVPIERLVVPVMTVTHSVLSRLQSDGMRCDRYTKRILTGFSLLTYPVAVFMAVYSDEFIVASLGETWAPASFFVRIFAAAVLVYPPLVMCESVMLSRGYARRYLAIGTVGAVTLGSFFVADWPLGPRV
jgi:O-antigen/teichoic acid export membrane protein